MEHKQLELEAEILEISAKLGIPAESNATEILKTIILSAVTEAASFDLDDQYDKIGRAYQITRERVRRILHKAVWNNWNVNSKDVLKNHFGADVQMNFEYVKPNHVEFIKLIADNLREKYYDLMAKEGLGYINPLSREFVYYTPEKMEKNKCEKIFKDRLYGEIWREIPWDFEQAWHYEEESMERLRKAPKDISAALEYLPTYIKALRAACEFIAPLLLSTVEEMTIANFNSTDTERFAEGWIDAMEQCGIEESMLLDFYLLGQCSLPHHEAPVVMARAKRNFARALEDLSKLLFASECYDYDLELQRLVYNMRKVGYSEDKVAVFATRYITELSDIIDADGWYSSMYMRLFGEHMSGAQVDTPGLCNFEKAIEFLPEYVDFVVHVEVLSRYTNRLDPDEVLYALIEKMREHDFSKEQISRFATEWMNAMEKTGNVSYMRMHAYLFDEFSYATYPPENNYKLVYDITPLCGLKDLARALEHIPEWIEYMNSPEHYDFVQPPDICVNEVTLKMRECGYTDTEVEEFNARVLASMPATSPDSNDFLGS